MNVNNSLPGVYSNDIERLGQLNQRTNGDRYDELNQRISERNIPSAYLEPQFSLRPVSTKYATLPMVDRRIKAETQLRLVGQYNVGQVFNPGTAQSPWSGYSNNVDIETVLRNQVFALQKNGQSTYMPSTNSDLYETQPVLGRQEVQPFPSLFEEPNLAPFNSNPQNIAQDIFNNSTRQQIKNSSGL